ncbi:hypothetical protein Anas_08370 [Armadillidium nasatum]|uniref:Uncharacterized protein n=1 Tax=Armadillidium nasatum TaxID=96803 RepID=A0A5N5TA96_9CRUS|nr:hypothetical protein Anas_08370 [Armadillidium nasatum]
MDFISKKCTLIENKLKNYIIDYMIYLMQRERGENGYRLIGMREIRSTSKSWEGEWFYICCCYMHVVLMYVLCQMIYLLMIY